MEEEETVELERQLRRQKSEGDELQREIMAMPDENEQLVKELGLASMVRLSFALLVTCK